MSKNNIDILYLASHGFAVRMLIQTDLLSKLKARGYSVGIVTSDSTDPSVTDYCKKNGISNIEFKETATRFQPHLELFRKYILEDVKKNPALYEKHLRLRDQASKSFSYWWKYNASSSIYSLVKKFPGIRTSFKRYERKLLTSADADNLIKNYCPKLVISTVPVNIWEAKLLHSASNANIKTTTHILSWDNISCKGHFRQLTDEFIVWGEIMKNELIKYYGIEPARIHETGVPHFDVHFQQQANNTSANTERYIFFAMSSPYFAPREIDVVEKIASWVEQDTWPGLNFCIRPHPQNVIGNLADLNWLPRLKKLESTRVIVNYPGINEHSGINWSMKQDDMYEMSKLVGNASIVLNSCSTMSIDGLSFDKPVIVTAFDNEEILPWHISVKRVMEYEHFRNLIESGAVKKVDNYADLKHSITAYLADPTLDSTKRKKFLYREIGIGDGNSTDRVVDSITAILAKSNNKRPAVLVG